MRNYLHNKYGWIPVSAKLVRDAVREGVKEAREEYKRLNEV